MPSTVEVVVPFLGGCQHRDRAAKWLLPHYLWPVTIAPGGAPWCKAAAITPAVERSSADIIICADADVWCDALSEAVAAVEAGAPWARPHRMVHRLASAGTDAVLVGADWRDQPLEQRRYYGVDGGGYVVARRETLLDVPLDPRFVGWGQEDCSHGLALHTLAGPAWRGDAPLVHLYHPPQARMDRKRGSPAGWALYHRYVRAARDPALMYALIEEAKDAARAATQPPLHDHAPQPVG